VGLLQREGRFREPQQTASRAQERFCGRFEIVFADEETVKTSRLAEQQQASHFSGSGDAKSNTTEQQSSSSSSQDRSSRAPEQQHQQSSSSSSQDRSLQLAATRWAEPP